MIASLHLADVTMGSAVRRLRRPPAPGAVAGLSSCTLATAASLNAIPLPSPDPRRLALVSFWADDAALDSFERDHELGAELVQRGWHTRLDPVRATGTWPGLDPALSSDRHLDPDGPAVVLTIGRLRLGRALAFVRAGSKAQGRALESPGLIWGAGLARLPVVSSLTIWESSDALRRYAYGAPDGDGAQSHVAAMSIDQAKPFHHEGAFIRFRPYATAGQLSGTNPMPEWWATEQRVS